MNFYANESTIERYFNEIIVEIFNTIKKEKALDEMVNKAQKLGLYEYTTEHDNPLDE